LAVRNLRGQLATPEEIALGKAAADAALKAFYEQIQKLVTLARETHIQNSAWS
jgi:hypothetical protein